MFRPTLFRSAFVFALLAVSLNRWGAIWAVVAGIVAALLFLGGIGRFGLDLYRRPKLEIEVGTGPEFEKRVGSTDDFARSAVEDNKFTAAFLKVIRIHERKGRSRAKAVVLRIVEVDPPHPHFRAVTMRWLGGGEEADIQPEGHRDAVVQFVALYQSQDGTQIGARATPPILEHAESIDFAIQVLIDGRKYKRVRMRIEHPWPDKIMEHEGPGDWPDPFTFPVLTRLS